MLEGENFIFALKSALNEKILVGGDSNSADPRRHGFTPTGAFNQLTCEMLLRYEGEGGADCKFSGITFEKDMSGGP